MSILWCGGEDVDFTPAASVDAVATHCRAGYARCGVYNSSAYSKSATFGPVTSAWATFRIFRGALTANLRFGGFGKSGGDNALLVGTDTTYTSKLALYKRTAGVNTQIAAESGASIGTGLHRIDMQVTNFGASAVVNVYVDGALVLTFSGDPRPAGVNSLDQLWIWGSAVDVMSEFIVADEDTRLFSLVSLYPARAGDSSLWGQSTAGENGFKDLSETTTNDATVWYTDTVDQDAQVQLYPPPIGSFDVRAVKIAARASKTVGATAGSVKLGLNLSKTAILSGGDLPTLATFSVSANNKALRKITPSESASITALRGVPQATSATAKLKGVIYADNAGSPGVLLATSTEVIGTTAGSLCDLPFSSPYAVTAGTSYWIGIITDTSIGWYCSNSSASGPPVLSNSDTYSDGAASPAGTMTSSSSAYALAIEALKAGDGLESPMPAAVALSTSWETKERLLTVNPRTGLAFTAQDLTGLQINFRSAS